MLNDNLNYLGNQYKKRFHTLFLQISKDPKKGVTKRGIPLIFGLQITNQNSSSVCSTLTSSKKTANR